MFQSLDTVLPQNAILKNLQQMFGAAFVCERARGFFRKNFPETSDEIVVHSFAKGVLKISAKNSSARSDLFLKKNWLIAAFAKQEVLNQIKKISF